MGGRQVHHIIQRYRTRKRRLVCAGNEGHPHKQTRRPVGSSVFRRIWQAAWCIRQAAWCIRWRAGPFHDACIDRILMIGLRAIPIIGWVVMAVTLGLWLWRNWDVIWKKVKAIGTWASKMIVGIGTWASKMIVGAWVWVKKKIGPLWTVLKSALGRALKTFIWWFLDQWQFLFNTILSGINKILPKAWELKRLSFADQYRARHLPDKQSRHIAPRAVQTVQVHSVINLKDQAIAKVVTTHQARAANRSGTGASLFDPTMGVLPIGMA